MGDALMIRRDIPMFLSLISVLSFRSIYLRNKILSKIYDNWVTWVYVLNTTIKLSQCERNIYHTTCITILSPIRDNVMCPWNIMFLRLVSNIPKAFIIS